VCEAHSAKLFATRLFKGRSAAPNSRTVNGIGCVDRICGAPDTRNPPFVSESAAFLLDIIGWAEQSDPEEADHSTIALDLPMREAGADAPN
jgi:hypothetical protein